MRGRGARAARLHEIAVEIEVPFHDVDGLRVVWHGHYYKYLELARTQLLRSVGLDVGDLIGKAYGFMLIESGCRHVAPLRYRDRARVVAWIRDFRYRVCVQYEVLNITTGRRAAYAHTALATTDTTGRMLLVTPAAIVERLLGRGDGPGTPARPAEARTCEAGAASKDEECAR
jgi:acyl-CoA thioester hydrolase